MDKLIISPTSTTPEIRFSVEDDIYRISGTSRPEDVREMYYPVIEWIKELIDNILDGTINKYSTGNPMKFQVDLLYFNSSSAKFIYDIFAELKRLAPSGIPIIVEWYYEEDDADMLEAGNDFSILAEMEFSYIAKEVE